MNGPDEEESRPEGERTVRLASIVSIDVAGFSSMSERDQKRAARNIEALRARIDAVATRHEGRIFNTAGDGFMLEFASAGSALSAINELLDNKPKGEPPIRVGAHVGDVVVTITNDLLGHGVNVAARLQSLAPPGAALVSGEFRSMARNSPQAAFQSRGRQPLENIDQRVATFAIISRKQRFRRLVGRTAASMAVIAVLAVATVFGGPPLLRFIDSQDFFARSADGLAAAAVEEPPPVSAPAPAQAAAPETPAPAAAAPAFSPGQTIKDCPSCPELVVVPGGGFQMGSPATERGRFATEGPLRAVTIRPFAASVYEITFQEWDACLAGGGCGGYSPPDRGWGRGRRPVVGVSWTDAQAYVQWLNRQTGSGKYRLLTEAEWEYAARAGSSTRYAMGDTLARGQAAFGVTKTDAVGAYSANAFGLYDMHGNVWEWVEDCYAPSYAGAPTDGSAVGGACAQRAYRGGGYADRVDALRSANRRRAAPALRDASIGFRVARDLDQASAQ